MERLGLFFFLVVVGMVSSMVSRICCCGCGGMAHLDGLRLCKLGLSVRNPRVSGRWRGKCPGGGPESFFFLVMVNVMS